jgi:hypothetical protein
LCPGGEVCGTETLAWHDWLLPAVKTESLLACRPLALRRLSATVLAAGIPVCNGLRTSDTPFVEFIVTLACPIRPLPLNLDAVDQQDSSA